MGQTAKPIGTNMIITIDFQNEATYFQLLGNGKSFAECVLASVLSSLNPTLMLPAAN